MEVREKTPLKNANLRRLKNSGQPSPAGTLCRAPMDMHMEYVSELRVMASRNQGMAGVAKIR